MQGSNCETGWAWNVEQKVLTQDNDDPLMRNAVQQYQISPLSTAYFCKSWKSQKLHCKPFRILGSIVNTQFNRLVLCCNFWSSARGIFKDPDQIVSSLIPVRECLKPRNNQDPVRKFSWKEFTSRCLSDPYIQWRNFILFFFNSLFSSPLNHSATYVSQSKTSRVLATLES